MRTNGRTKWRSALRDERGMLLVITMIIMLVVSTLAAANLINAFLERSIAKNQNFASIALNAADAGIAEGMAWLRDNRTSVPRVSPWTGVGWPPVIPDRALASGGVYNVTLAFKIDVQDRDKDGDLTEIVRYNKAIPAAAPGSAANHGKFDYENARFDTADTGYAIITITSRGSYGASGYREIEMDVARDRVNTPGVRGAVSSVVGADFGNSASQRKDGRAYALNDVLCETAPGVPNPAASPACEDNTTLPGVTIENTVGLPNDEGKDDTIIPDATPPITINAGAPLCATAECVLGYGTRAELEQAGNVVIYDNANPVPYKVDNDIISTAMANGPPGRTYIIHGSFQLQTNVTSDHASVIVVDGNFDAKGNTSYSGLIISQNFNVTGNFQLTGATVCIGPTGGTPPYSNGTVDFRYSGDALAKAVGQDSYATRLGWHRLR